MARKGLGRGLDAILGEAGAVPERPAGNKDIVRLIPLGDIRPDPAQPRKAFDDAAIEELAASIRAQGLLQPILVRPAEGEEGYIIIAGERRWRAAARAGLHDIPALVRSPHPAALSAMALIENLQREDLNAMEEADAYAALRDNLGKKPDEIAEAVGKSRSHVANMLRLTALPPSVRAHVVAGKLTMGHARALLAAKDPAALAEIVVAKGLSVRETERLVADPVASGQPKKNQAAKNPAATPAPTSGPKDADTKSLERDLEAALGLSVAIEHGKKGGHVTLTYDTLEQLDDICRRLMGSFI